MNEKRVPTALRTLGVVLLLTALFGTMQTAEAQPNLNFKRVTVNWPTIELYFSVGCNGNPAYNMAKQDFKIFENGVEVKEFTLWCPDPTVRCAISVALVFDASGSMIGSGNAGAKAAGRAFVDQMDGQIDEAAIIWFNTQVNIQQQMTTIKPMLYAAVDALPASGGTAVWDGCYAGILELINNGVNQCRAVIVMTDGGDNASTRTPAEIISLANRNRIRVFTIGLGGSINATELEMIALLTGGRYYQTPNSGQLAAIYKDISTIIFQGFQECVITYERDCADGGLRTVELQLINFCGGTDVKTKTYRAPLDSSTFSDLYMDLGDAEGKGDTDVRVPLHLVTSIDPETMFYPLTFTLLFDQQCMQFKSVQTPPGSMIEGMPIDVTPVAGGVQISTLDRKLLKGNGLLMEFTFHASDPADTICCELEAIDPKFEQGCFIPIIDPGEVCILPRKPIVNCDLEMPRELTWQRAIKDYLPNPFTVTGRFFNTGDKEAQNTRFKITYNSNDLQLVSPLTDVQTGSPKDIQPGNFSEVSWQLAAKRRTSGDSTEVCITAFFDNHEEVICCKKVFIPPTEPILECVVDVPTITADNANVRYNPMPFPVTVTVTNTGGMRTDSVFATIIVPPDLKLAGADAPDNHTKRIMPSLLFPQQSGSVQWMVTHPASSVERQYVIQVWVKTTNADSSLCEAVVIIPPLEAPVLAPRCKVPTALVFDENLDSYVPNPFTVTLTCVNNGKTTAENVTGTIILPPDMEFDPPGQQETKTFTPSTMGPWQLGDPIPELTWTVRWTKRYRYDVEPDFRFTVTGKNFAGIQLDSTEVHCRVPVPGLLPLFSCDIDLPTSLELNAAETDVEPNPFTVRYTIRNASNQVGSIRRVIIYFPTSDGLSLDAASPNISSFDPNLTLDKGESETFEWLIKVANRITQRNVQIQVIAYDDEGNPIPCDGRVRIAPLKTALTCDLRTDEPALRYIPVLTEYEPQKFVISGTLRNAGGANLNDVVGLLTWVDNSGQDLIELDPDYADNTNPKTRGVLFPATEVEFSWGFRLKNKNTTGIPQYMAFNLEYGSKETPYITSGCEAYVEIDPVVSPNLVCSLGAVDTVRFVVDQYDPSEFEVDLHVENIGTGEARNVKAYLLQDTRFTIVPPSERSLGNIASMEGVDLLGPDGFTLRVNPRDVSGYDTIRAVVVGEGTSTTCELPIYVERELRPKFELLCKTDVTLRFDDGADDYVPNPFPVETTVKNVGDTRAKDAKLIFVGPPRFSPFDRVKTISLGDLEVNEERTVTWQMVPLRRDVGGTEQLKFQVHGAGGLGDRIIIGECLVDVYVPPARAAEYACDLTIQDVRFDPTTGGYVPDPFVVTTTVENTGEADGMGLFAEISLESGLFLESGQQPRKDLGGTLLPGATSTALQWNVRPIARTEGAWQTVTITYTDRFGNTTTCAEDVYIPEAPEPGLTLACETELKELVVDRARGEYEKSTFKVRAYVGNTSGRSIYNVRVSAISLDREHLLLIAPPSEKPVAQRLDNGAPEVLVEWDATALPRPQEGYVDVLFLVSGEDEVGNPVPTRECQVTIFIPEVGEPRLECRLFTSVTDAGVDIRYAEEGEDARIAYDESRGDYEGEKSAFGDYTVFTVRAVVENKGDAQANRVRVMLLLPTNLTLDEGESAIKYVSPEDLTAGSGLGEATWNVRPIAIPEAEDQCVEVLVTAENSDPQKCELCVELAEAPRTVVLTLPDDIVGSYGEKVTVPVLVGETLGRDVYAYRLTIRHDPSLIRFIDATSVGTLTGRGWNGVKAQTLTEAGSAAPNLVRVEDYTTGTPLSTSRTGALVFLRFEVVHNRADIDASDYVVQSPLEYVMDTRTETGARYLSTMNATADDESGEVALITFPGQVTVSGDCILPLSASTRLEQNTPNPFNPSTTIPYQLGEETDYTLVLFDALGRKVRVLEEGHKAAGRYEVVVDMGNLPSGVYVYRLETPTFVGTKRMILSR
jgi:Mg-chelatase subunit ChlD